MSIFAITGSYRNPDVWHFVPHPEVWVLDIALITMYVYAIKVIGPKVVPEGTPVVTRKQLWAFGGAMFLLELASDWPMHDIAEEYLYSVHMLQHWILTLVMAPLFLIATPRWLADLVLGQGRGREIVRRMARPIPTSLAFNFGIILSHWPYIVNHVVGGKSGFPHFGLHLFLVATSLLMWNCVCGPIEEWRISRPTQMIYLFMQSVIPTIPGAWLTFANAPVYQVYNTPFRAFGISAVNDQQLAGVIMKLGEGGWIWLLITIMFFRWVALEEKANEAARKAKNAERLEQARWKKLEAEFASEATASASVAVDGPRLEATTPRSAASLPDVPAAVATGMASDHPIGPAAS